MKRNYLILFLALFILVSSKAFAVDPPHSPEIDQFKTDKCLRCHGSQYPFPGLVNQVGSSIDNTATNLLCRGCHDDGIAVNAVVHSSLTTTEEKGIWSAGCTSCHDPHYQYQYKTWGSESFLSTGTIASVVGNTITVNGVNWTPNIWNGYIVVPNTRYGYTYKITSNTGNTLTVKGPILTRYAGAGSTLGIFYGKLIKSSVGIGKNINGTYTKSVKFFNSTGPYSIQTASTNNNDKAICVVCHTKTQYMNIERIYNGTSVSHNQTDTNSCYANEAGCHKQHKQGFQRAAAVACGDCHGNPPLNNTPGGGGVVYKTKIGGVLVDNTTGPLANNVSGGAHQKHAISRGYGCETCHYGGMWAPNPAPNPQQPDDLKITMGFYLAGDTNGYYWGRKASAPNQTLWNGFTYNGTAATAGDNTYRCSNLYCHSNANPLGGTMAYKLPTWNGTPYTGGVCNQCHSASSESSRTWSVKHDKHVVIYNANALYNCNACHSTVASDNNTISGQGYHVNRTKDVVFNGVNPNALAYNSTANQCSNLYCHSNANPLGGTMTYKYPKWNDAAYGSVCNECHTNPSGDSGWSSAHSKHAGVSAGKYAFTCDECHAEVVANNSNTTIIDYSKHVNASKNVKFSTTLRSSTLNQSGGGYTATYSCTNTYCHSQGTSKTAPFTAPVTVATWDGSMPSDCSGCHQSKANLSTGSHGKHLTGGGYNFNCVKCHSSVMGTPANDIAINTPSLHVDAINEVVWDSYNSGGSNYNAAGAGTCSNIYCHSQGTKGSAPYGAATVTATWGNTTFPSSECSGCHGGNSQASGAKMSTGAHTSHINNASVLGTNFKCQDCHATTVSGDRTIAYISNHVDKNINIAFTGQNAVGATYNGQATPRALPAGHGEAKTCSNLYCHSDGKNSYQSVSWTGPAIGCNGCHGLGEVYGRPNYANTGPGTMNANSHLASTHSKTECNACHYNTVADFANSPIKSGSTLHINKTIDVVFNATIGGTWTGGSSKTCTDVSCHSGVWYWGGAAVGCTGCHEASAALAGLHSKHYNTTTPSADFGGDLRSTSTQYVYGCGNCHPSNQHAESDGVADVRFDLSTWSPSPYNGGTYQYGISTATDSKGKIYTQDGTCTNIYCHSSGLTYTGTPTYKSVKWNDPAVNCDSCHNAGRTTLTTNKHPKHIAGTSGNYNFACKECHFSVLSTDTSIGDKSLHVNRAKNVVWNSINTGGSSYEASGTGQCSNIYCHSQGTSGSAPYPTLNVAQWNGTGFPTDCTGCHKGYVGSSSAIDTYAHTSHINNASYVGWKITCSECHNATVAVGNNPITGIGNHVDKLVNIKFDNSKNLSTDNPYYNGVIATGSTGAVKSPGAVASTGCSNVYCHSSGNIKDGVGNVQFRTVKWNDPAMGCNGCHGTSNARGYSDFANTGAGLANANSHYKHADAAASNIGCVACHRDTTLDGSTVNTTSGLHINRAEDVVFNSIGGKTGTYNADKSCSNTYCHGTLSAKWGAAPMTCDNCHSGNKNLAPSHALHWNSTSFANSTDISLANNISTTTANIFTCANCHPSTHANGPAGTNRAAEVSFNITWAGTGNTTGSYTQGAANAVDSRGFDWRTGGSCTNLYCHSNAKPVTGSGGFARSNIYVNAIWNSGSLSCNGCHDAPNTGSSTWSAAHDKHVDAAGGAYSFTCNNCHAATANNNTQIGNYALHVNATKDVVWNSVNAGGSAYQASTYTCSNIYCHSTGTSGSAPYGSVTAVWNTALPTDCTGCHKGYVGSSSAIDTYAHTSHINNASYVGWKITCSECHNATVAVGNNPITGIGNHVDKLVNIKFDNSKNLSTDNPYYNGVIATGSTGAVKSPGAVASTGCSNVYCHSSGNIRDGVGNVQFRTVKWNDPAMGCNGCHGTGNARGYSDFANTGAGLANANSHYKHADAAASNIGCVACHRDTTLDGSTVNTTSGLHINRAEDVIFNSIGGKTGTYNADKSCSNTYCHGTLSAKWGAAPMTCDDCHSGNKNLAPSHALHWNSTSFANSTDISLANNISTTTANIFTCANCHPSTHANGPAGTNRAAEVSFNITWAGTGNTTGSYTQGAANAVDSRGFDWRTGGSCTNLYCHSNAKPVTGSGGFARSNIYANPIWNGGSLSCNGCHDAPNTGSSTWSAAHDKHVDAAGGAYSFTCNNCHAATANNNTQIGNYALHVNATKNVAFNSLAAYNGYVATYEPSTNRCSNIYCHSAGFSISNQSAVPSNPNYAVWNSALAGNCTGCHGGAGGAYPQYANGNPKWNSHNVADHKAGTCADCHQAVVGINNTIIDPSLHVNTAYNVSNSTYIGGYTFRTMAQGKSTCVSVSCHGGNNADWGSTLTCDNCHGTTGPDVDNFSGTFWSDGSISLINTNEWTTTGHGRTSGTYSSGNPAANKTCTACHSAGVAHKTATNPFRLAYTAVDNATWGWNWNCTVCHATGQSGATKKVDSRHYGAKHATTRNGGQFCWDCHDPHGDSNVYMVGAQVASVSNSTYGWPTTTNATVFTAFGTGTDYAKSSAPYNGVCNVCHTQTSHYTASSGDGHNSGQRCTSCHAHTKAGDINQAFAGAGESSGGQACSSCHAKLYGKMHNSIANMVYKHYLNNDNPTYLVNASVSNTVSHKLSGTADTNRNCLICHADHDIFRPDINTGVGNRGGNLRASIKVQPQKGAANTSTWSYSDFNGNRDDGGICLSCHRSKQAKALQTNNGVNNVPPIPFPTSVAQNDVAPWNSNAIVKNSTHNYSVQSGVFSDNSKFQAVCLKCHNDTLSPKGQDVSGQSQEPKFGLHQSSKNGFFAVMGTGSFKDFNIGNVVSATTNTVTPDFTIVKDYTTFAVVITNASYVPQRAIIIGNTATAFVVNSWPSYTPQAGDSIEVTRNVTPVEEICFNCHSKNTEGYKSYANKDFYNATDMSNRLEGMYSLFVGDKGTHNGAASKTTITDTTKNWTPNGIWNGYYCVMKSGANAGRRSVITGNTATTLTVSFSSFVNPGDRYEIVKPASHPLDKDGLHKSDEAMSAGIGWNLGDQGYENLQTVSVSNTTFKDTLKAWTANAFVGNYVWLGRADGTFIKKQITANTVNSVTWSGAVTIDPGMKYYIGLDANNARHVSCSDCHNTHAAQVNPSGTIASGATTTSIKDTSKTLDWTGWANNKWKGYLFMYTDSSGVRRIRPISASTTDSTGTTYTLAIALPAAPSAGLSYEVLLTDGKTGSGGKGVWGVSVSGWTSAGQSSSTFTYTKKYDAGGDAGGMQYEQCLRCHSYYGFKTARPTALSGNADGTPVLTNDVAWEINPNNYAHHAIVGVGRNQPIVPDGTTAFVTNPYWPKQSNTKSSYNSSTGVLVLGSPLPDTVIPGWYVLNSPVAYQIVEVQSSTQVVIAKTNGNPWDPGRTYPASIGNTTVAITSGLGNTFVPPYGPWSILRCTDCHGSTLTDPLGPHASTNKWLVKDAEITLKFEWWNSSLTTISYTNSIDSGGYTLNVDARNKAYICFNCHRADVYGSYQTAKNKFNPNNNFQSRLSHFAFWTKDGSNIAADGTYGTTKNVKWPQYCRHCHAGDTIGGIHGTAAAGTSFLSTGKTGQRFMNGATWVQYANGTCYTIGTATNVSACTQHSGGTTLTFVYQYTYTGLK